ncbi:MAG: Alkaline phosphatase [Myxococcaceae bacterium]|nr:Alkaline phosphatase [Myxococcaceae bacterium]
MRTGRSYVATAVALGIITLSGCAAESDSSNASKSDGQNDDWGDENKYPELGGKFAGLTAFRGTCTFTNGTMTVSVATASPTDQALIIGKRAVDSALVVNGGLLTGCTTATASTVKALKVVGSTANETVIIDFLGGVFAPGIATARGISIDLVSGASDEVRFRGTSAVDSWVFGTDGLAVNTDAFRDVDFLNVDKFNFSLAGGDDTLTGTIVPLGLGAGKGVTATSTVGFVAFGGDGKDTITGGGGDDQIFGGPGNDTLAGGGVATGDTDWLSGQQGADIIAQGAANNGKDNISCGVEDLIDADHPDLKDTVTYALRGTAAARDITSAATLLATDSQRVFVTLGTCVDLLTNGTATATPDTLCDVDAKGFDIYVGSSGQQNEVWNNSGTGAQTQVENDAINADCEIIVGGSDNDKILGTDPDTTLFSTVANTTGPVTSYHSVSGNNELHGGVGDDWLVGGLGDDTLNGDEGADLLDETGAVATTGNDVLNGGADTDTVSYDLRTAAVIVTMDGVNADDGCTGETDDVNADIENLIGTDFADTITGNALPNVLTGGDLGDTMDGAGGNDTFNEGTASSVGDKFIGGAGTDTVDYSKRTVAVWVSMAGESADDGEATTMPVRDFSTTALLLGLESAVPTTLGASAENDTVMEDVENVLGSTAADDIVGNALDNTIDGGAGADVIMGLAGNDILFGGPETVAANDVILGGTGNDTLDGALGTANQLVCGGGEDIGVNQGSSGYRDSSCES